jgi:U3 small nucleolar RNA-associated protein 13
LGEDLIYTGGEKGIVKIWNWKTGALLHSFHADEMKKHAIVDIVHCQQDQTLVVITQDQNFLVYDVSNPVESIEKTRQLVGYNDQILDFAFVSGGEDADPQLATATNSEQIRVYDMQTRDCTVLAGHKEIVFCLDAFVAGSMLVSGSKDRSARVWKRVDGVYHNVGVCVGHTESVNAVAISPKTGRVLLSASQDRTIKSWDLSKCKFCVFNSVVAKESEGVENLKANYTFMAHEKDINALKIAPNEKVFASGSQDKTAKLWSMETGEQLGTFKGHKRGIWDVCFSPVDRVLATGSADKNVKIWSLADFSCLKTFEGHLNSVLRIRFISAGLQLVSSGADGLLKLWTVKTNECVNTFDGHEDKVWALEVDKSEMRIVSGGGDSKIVFWEDFTAVENEEARVEEELVIKE